MIPPHLVWMKEVLDLALDVLQRLKPAVRRDEGDQREDHDAHKHPRQRAAPPRPLLLHGSGCAATSTRRRLLRLLIWLLPMPARGGGPFCRRHAFAAVRLSLAELEETTE